MKRRTSTSLAILLLLACILSPWLLFAKSFSPFSGGGGSGDMAESTYTTDGRVKNSKGGTGADSSAWSGLVKVLAGVWSAITLDGNATHYLDGTGAFSKPAGGGGITGDGNATHFPDGSGTWRAIQTTDVTAITAWLASQLSGGTLTSLAIGDGNFTVDNFGNVTYKSAGSVRTNDPQYIKMYEPTGKGNKWISLSVQPDGFYPDSNETYGGNETTYYWPRKRPTFGAGYMSLMFPSMGTGQNVSVGEWLYGLYSTAIGSTGLVKTTGTQMISYAVDGTDYMSPTGTATMTSKTYDASATGNVLKQYKYVTLTSPAWCDETGSVMQTTAANKGQYRQCKFSATAAASGNYAIYQWQVPQDIDTTINMAARWYYRLGGADTDRHSYRLTLGHVTKSGAADTPTWADANASSINVPGDASGADGDLEIVPADGNTTMRTLTGWRNYVPGRLMLIRVARQGDNATTDNSTVDSYSQQLTIRYQSSL